MRDGAGAEPVEGAVDLHSRRVEDPYVGARYGELVAATRRIAGPMITDAWNREPAAVDSNVHNPGWYFSELEPFDDAYLRAVADHLGWIYAPARRRLRGWFRREKAQASELGASADEAKPPPDAPRLP